jgi:excisionase family DNA binding protein
MTQASADPTGPGSRLLHPIPEAARLLGVSDRTTWELIRSGKLRSVLVERRARRIPHVALIEYVDALIAAEANR